MEFFIDTADIGEIKKAEELGILDGVTTNPSLIAKTGKSLKKAIKEITDIVKSPVSAEVLSTNKDGIIKEAMELAEIAPNIVVKVPLIAEGLKAVKILSERNIATNVTLCFSALQALLAAKCGATYVSPFVGRLDDIGHTGMDLIGEIVTIYENYAYDTKIIVASIRNPIHLKDSAMMGAHVATIPPDVFNTIVKHPLTDKGLEKFLEDAKKFQWD
ncbi:MAG: fructose-6-phosphate aldolase [Spirochaetia bacterium]|nr:fructose-6-phosphate aldolase [Spirochaetia bacterium]